MLQKLLISLLALASLGGSVRTLADQGITSPIHNKYQGQIVWSNTPIDFKKENESNFKTQFEAKDNIYGRVYLKKAINNHLAFNQGHQTQITQGGYEIRAFINGQKAQVNYGTFHTASLSGSKGSEWTTFRFSPRPESPNNEFSKMINQSFAMATSRLNPGDHEIKFEIYGQQGQFTTKNPIASGMFTLKLSEGERISSLTQFPQDQYQGDDITSIKSAIRNALNKNLAKSPDEVLDVSLSGDWQHGRFKTAPFAHYRKMTAAILWHDTDNNGLCRFTSYHFVQEQFTGDQWSDLKFQSFCMNCEEGDVDCP